MFGFQRMGDQIWAFADSRGKGFLVGATAGRTTLNGEGLQHQDGHSHLLMSVVPNCAAYDPAFAYEMAAIIEDGCRRMLVDEEDVLYYLTLYNENYAMPPMPKGVEKDLLRGLYRFEAAPAEPSKRATILFSGPAWRAAGQAPGEVAQHHHGGAP